MAPGQPAGATIRGRGAGTAPGGQAEGGIPSFLAEPGPRLVLFAGKGGVGKTTAAAASALALAARHPDRRYLVLSTDPAHSLLDAFAGGPWPENLEVRELDAAERLEGWRRENGAALGEIVARGTPLTRDEARELVSLPLPGEDEVMAILEVASALASPGTSRVLIDTAPAGHTLLLLDLPRFLGRFAAALSGLLEKDRVLAETFGRGCREDRCEALVATLDRHARTLRALLASERECEVVLVANAEPAVLEETRSLLRSLGALRVPVRNVVLNRLAPARACADCRSRRAAEEALLARALPADVAPRLIRVERLDGEARGPARLATLGEALLGLDHSQFPVPSSQSPVLSSRFPVPSSEAAELGTGNGEQETGNGKRGTANSVPGTGARLALPDRPVILVGGKGGVGKTTLAAAAALFLGEARPKERLLLFSADPARTLSKVLGVRPGREGAEVAPGLVAAELDLGSKLDGLKRRLRRALGRPGSGAAGARSLDREALGRLIDMLPPGLAETLAVLEVARVLREGRFDRIVLDTAPTGHLLRLLEAPGLARAWAERLARLLRRVPGGRRLGRFGDALEEIGRDADLFQRTFRAGGRAALVAVSIPTALGYEETRDLVAATRLSVPLGAIVVNRLTPARADCPRCAAYRKEEDAWAARISALAPDVRSIGLETAAEGFAGLPAFAALGRRLFDAPPGAGGEAS